MVHQLRGDAANGMVAVGRRVQQILCAGLLRACQICKVGLHNTTSGLRGQYPEENICLLIAQEFMPAPSQGPCSARGMPSNERP